MTREAAQAQVDALAEWSEWVPIVEATQTAPRLPGVYLIRDAVNGDIVYVGMAGERSGSGKPQGLRGRLSVYLTGKGAVSGFGEAVFDRALADPEWVRAQLDRLLTEGPQRSKQWAAAALTRVPLEARWTVLPDKTTAHTFEKQVEDVLRAHGLWNR